MRLDLLCQLVAEEERPAAAEGGGALRLRDPFRLALLEPPVLQGVQEPLVPGLDTPRLESAVGI